MSYSTYWRVESHRRGDKYASMSVHHTRMDAKRRWRAIRDSGSDVLVARLIECKPGEEPRVVAEWRPS